MRTNLASSTRRLDSATQGVVRFCWFDTAIWGFGEIRGELIHSVCHACQNRLERRLFAPWQNAVIDGLGSTPIHHSEKPADAAEPTKLFWEGCRPQELIHITFKGLFGPLVREPFREVGTKCLSLVVLSKFLSLLGR